MSVPEGAKISKICQFFVKADGTKYCSPLFSKTVDGECQMYLKSQSKAIESKDKTPSTFVCNSMQHISIELVSDLVEDCISDGHDEVELQYMLQKKAFYSCTNQHQIPCREGHPRCFNISHICIFDMNSMGYLVPCRTGEHMQNCSLFVCNKMFKCNKSYCIPWQYTCDGKWDCVDGSDESTKQKCEPMRECRNMFMCKLSQICVHLQTVCDSYLNCPSGDDEELCDLKDVFCPKSCQCVTYAAYCVSVQLYEWSVMSISAFLILHVKESQLPNQIVTPFMSAIYISKSVNDLVTVCTWLNKANILEYVSITFTKINHLEQYCFSQAKNLKFCELTNTNIQHLAENTFSMLISLIHINLSSNSVQWISDKAFHFLPSLEILSLLNTSTFEVSLNPFLGLNIKIFETNIIYLCCLVPEGAQCSLVVPSYISCLQILQNTTLRIVCVLTSVSAFVLNVLSILTQSKRNRSSQKFGAFELIVSYSCAGNVLLCFPLVILWVADIIYKKNFATRQELWQSGSTCLFVFGLFLCSISVILTSSCFMALARLFVVKYPLESKFREPNFVTHKLAQLFFASAFVSILLSVVQWLLSFLDYGILSVLCSPFYDPTNTSVFLKVLTWSVYVAFISGIVVFYICSSNMVAALRMSQEQVRSTLAHTTTYRSILVQISILAISNFMCWGSTSVILAVSVLVNNFPVLVMFWTTIVLIPMSSIVNPCVFIVLSFKQRFGF